MGINRRTARRRRNLRRLARLTSGAAQRRRDDQSSGGDQWLPARSLQRYDATGLPPGTAEQVYEPGVICGDVWRYQLQHNGSALSKTEQSPAPAADGQNRLKNRDPAPRRRFIASAISAAIFRCPDRRPSTSPKRDRGMLGINSGTGPPRWCASPHARRLQPSARLSGAAGFQLRHQQQHSANASFADWCTPSLKPTANRGSEARTTVRPRRGRQVGDDPYTRPKTAGQAMGPAAT